ncbi:hypothetical protein LZ32DRAFT_126787 [Colletotrichum eremochloae]|nr:hypothetical protein LZ32DRAFT_126787 [Colletotrichum eremochloae]
MHLRALLGGGCESYGIKLTATIKFPQPPGPGRSKGGKRRRRRKKKKRRIMMTRIQCRRTVVNVSGTNLLQRPAKKLRRCRPSQDDTRRTGRGADSLPPSLPWFSELRICRIGDIPMSAADAAPSGSSLARGRTFEKTGMMMMVVVEDHHACMASQTKKKTTPALLPSPDLKCFQTPQVLSRDATVTSPLTPFSPLSLLVMPPHSFVQRARRLTELKLTATHSCFPSPCLPTRRVPR